MEAGDPKFKVILSSNKFEASLDYMRWGRGGDSMKQWSTGVKILMIEYSFQLGIL